MTTDAVLADCPYKSECDAKGEHVALGCPDIRADRARKWGKLKGVEVLFHTPDERHPNGFWWEARTADRIPDPATPEGMVAWMEAIGTAHFDRSEQSGDWWVLTGDTSVSGPTLLVAFANAVDKLEVGT